MRKGARDWKSDRTERESLGEVNGEVKRVKRRVLGNAEGMKTQKRERGK